MANMGYVRFANTYSDLLDCYREMNSDRLSGSEDVCRWKLIQLAKKISEEYGDMPFPEDGPLEQ